MSLTFVGLFVGLFSLLLQKAGIEVAPEAVQGMVETFLLIVSGALVWWGRYRQGDVSMLGVRK